MQPTNHIKSSGPYSALNFYLTELNTFSNLKPNTDVHRDRHGHFIPTATSVSWIRGAQTIANLWKGHSHRKTANDIRTFAQDLIIVINSEVKNAGSSSDDTKRKIFRNLIYINKKINEAVNGKREGGGMKGLVPTFSDDTSAKKSLEQSLRLLQDQSLETLKLVRDNLPKSESVNFPDNKLLSFISHKRDLNVSRYCPEEFYSDEEWELAIEQSKDLRKEIVNSFKLLFKYKISLMYNEARNLIDTTVTEARNLLGKDANPSWTWWNKIGQFEKGDLFLGALPLGRGMTGYKGKNDLNGIKEAGVKAILSVVEVFENKTEGILVSPITPNEWAKNGVKQLQLPTPDFESIPLETILRGVEYIHWNLKNGRSTYVHCKAGRARSALIEMCYLIKYQKMTAQEAFDLIKSKRPQAGFKTSSEKWKTLKRFESLYSVTK